MGFHFLRFCHSFQSSIQFPLMRIFKFILLMLICACLLWVVGRHALPLTRTSTSRCSDSHVLVGRASCTQEPVSPQNEQTHLQNKVGVTSPEMLAPIPLIAGAEKTDVPWTSRTPAAKRVRRIFPDPEMMLDKPVLKAGELIRLALFDDAVFDAKISNVTHYPNGAVGMTAHLQGDQQGTVYLSTCDQQLRVSVEVPGGDDYYVRYNPETGEHYAIEVDPENTEVRECGDRMIPSMNSARSERLAPPEDFGPLGRASLSERAEVPLESAADAPPGSTVIAVMIVYTPKALSDEGGLSGMNNNISLVLRHN